jgi:hypothetical protein
MLDAPCARSLADAVPERRGLTTGARRLGYAEVVATSVRLLIVDPRRPKIFKYLQNRFKDEPGVQIIWDRRRGERR